MSWRSWRNDRLWRTCFDLIERHRGGRVGLVQAADDLARGARLRLIVVDASVLANVSAYDAASVALAEGLDCELLTGDGRLANAPGIRCAIRSMR